MINAIAVDDESPALEVLADFCGRLDKLELVKTFTHTGEARLYLESNPVDLIFLDIHMPRESGLDFAKTLTQPTLLIFTTAYSNFAVESYEVEAVDYLLKPFSFERFKTAVQRASNRWRTATTNSATARQTSIYLRIDHKLVNIKLADILFIEGLDNYLKIYLIGGQSLVVRLTMKVLLDKLPLTHFCRVHRSYIVALDKIQAVQYRMIYINDEKIPLSSSFEKDFLRQLGR